MKLFKLIGAVIWAIPAYYLWNYLAPIYLPQLPEQYLNVPYWHVAGIFALIQIVKMMIVPSYRYKFARHCGFGRDNRYYGRFCHKFSQHGFWTEKYRHE